MLDHLTWLHRFALLVDGLFHHLYNSRRSFRFRFHFTRTPRSLWLNWASVQSSKLTDPECHCIKIAKTKKHIEIFMAQLPLTSIKFLRNWLCYPVYTSFSFTSSSFFFIVRTLEHLLFMTKAVFKLFFFIQRSASNYYFFCKALSNEYFFHCRDRIV